MEGVGVQAGRGKYGLPRLKNCFCQLAPLQAELACNCSQRIVFLHLKRVGQLAEERLQAYTEAWIQKQTVTWDPFPKQWDDFKLVSLTFSSLGANSCREEERECKAAQGYQPVMSHFQEPGLSPPRQQVHQSNLSQQWSGDQGAHKLPREFQCASLSLVSGGFYHLLCLNHSRQEEKSSPSV